MIPSFFISSDFITVVCDNKPSTIYSNDARFSQLKDAIKARAWDEIGKIISIPKRIALFTQGKVKVFDGVVMYNNKELHNTLTARILEFYKEGFPFEPLTCFMDKLMENPSERSKEQVYQFMEANKLPVTEDGDVIFFKVVTKDFKDCHTRKIDNSIGQIVKMDRALVDDNPHSACSSGLHCASWSYCETFGGTDSIVLLVKVNPTNIVSVPSDYNASKVRVCEYEVVKVVGEKNKVVDFDSNLAAKNEVTAPEFDTGVLLDGVYDENANTIGANKAYELHKAGKKLFNDIMTVKPEENKPRNFFRKNKSLGWQVIQ